MSGGVDEKPRDPWWRKRPAAHTAVFMLSSSLLIVSHFSQLHPRAVQHQYPQSRAKADQTGHTALSLRPPRPRTRGEHSTLGLYALRSSPFQMSDQKVAIALHDGHRHGLSKVNTCQRHVDARDIPRLLGGPVLQNPFLDHHHLLNPSWSGVGHGGHRCLQAFGRVQGLSFRR